MCLTIDDDSHSVCQLADHIRTQKIRHPFVGAQVKTPLLSTSPADSASSPDPVGAGKGGGKGILQEILPFALVFLSGCLMFFLDLGSYPLFNPDEALYAEPAREMLETGQYVTTLLNYVVRFTKPPLVIWAMALSYKVFGVNEFAARFFGAASGAILLAGTYWFLRRYAGKKPAALGALTLATAPLFVGVAREAITDMPLALFLSGSLMSFYHAFEEKSSSWRFLGYVLIGLAVMTKGPVGLVLPVAIMSLFYVLRGQLPAAATFFRPLIGLFIVALIAIPWFALEIYVTGGAYYNEFIVRENFQRFTSVVDHKGAWWYHVAAMLGGFFPWSVFLPLAFVRLVGLCQTQTGPHTGGGTINPASSGASAPEGEKFKLVCRAKTLCARLPLFRQLSPVESLFLFAAVWSLTVLLFFSASVSKLIPYTLPAFPALAILVALAAQEAAQSATSRRLALPFFLLVLIYGGAWLGLPVALSRLREAPWGLEELLKSWLAIQLVTVSLGLLCVNLKRQQLAVALFAALTLVFSLYFGGRALPILSAEWEGPLPLLCRYASVSDWPILVFDMRKPSVPFYTGRQAILPGDRLDLEKRLSNLNKAYILSRSRDRQYLESLPGCRTVAEKGKFILVCLNRQGQAKHQIQ